MSAEEAERIIRPLAEAAEQSQKALAGLAATISQWPERLSEPTPFERGVLDRYQDRRRKKRRR